MDVFAPLRFPERVTVRALREVRGIDDRIDALIEQLGTVVEVWRDVARIAQEQGARLDEMERRGASLDSVLINLGPALESVPRIEVLMREGIDLAQEALPTLERAVEVSQPLLPVLGEATGKVDGLTATVTDASDKVDPLIETIDRAIATADPLIETIREALPVFERVAEMAEPLEGTVTRLGRLADRLPGGRE